MSIVRYKYYLDKILNESSKESLNVTLIFKMFSENKAFWKTECFDLVSGTTRPQ